jgi:hypothetical protein
MPTEIQFDRAEFKGDPVPVACTSCGAAIGSTYYQVGQAIACEPCRWRIETEATGGSPMGRFVKASLLGVLAAGAGAGVYYAVRALTGYEFGLIAIVVGLLVGGAVRMGSAQRGGVPYQLLAMFLTYASIVSTYIPDIVKAFRDQPVAEQAAPAAEAPTAPAPVAATGDAASAPVAAGPTPMGPLVLVLALAAVVAIAFAAPFLMGFGNIIGIVIIGIGLFEAWKINRKPDHTVTGPFRMADAASEAAPAAA